MAPLSRPAILSLTALTLHFSVLSIVLHLSRTLPGRRYHASSAIFLTELGKILFSFALVLLSGELRPAVRERLRIRALWRLREEERKEEEREAARMERERREEEEWRREMSVGCVGNGSGSGNGGLGGRRKSEEKEGLLGGRKVEGEDGWTEATVVPIHRRTSSLTANNTSSSTLSPHDSSSRPSFPPTATNRTGPGSSLSINVPLANGNSRQSSSAPSLALIPATPVPDPSPTRFPDQSALYPDRPLDGRFNSQYGYGYGYGCGEGGETIFDDLSTWEWWKTLWATVWGEGVWKLAVLAALFCFQGNAQYVASGNLSVPLFQLAYQLKIPATAMCSVILLNKALSRQQWASLFVLTFGVGLVQLFSVTGGNGGDSQLPSPSASVDSSSSSSALDALSAHSEAPPNQMLGLAAVVAACMSSGFASVYFERILKVPSSSLTSSSSSSTPSSATNSPDLSSAVLSPTLPSTNAPPPPQQQPDDLPSPSSIVPSGKPSLWIRNIQLSSFGLLVGFPIVLYEIRGCFSLGALDYGYLEASAEQAVAGAAEAGMGWLEKAQIVAVRAGEGFFDGFNGVTWVVIGLQITGGLLSALVMQYADNLLKCFSTSLSILLSVAASVVLFNFHITLGILLGSILVLGATFAYTSPSKDWRWRPSSNYVPLPQGLGTR